MSSRTQISMFSNYDTDKITIPDNREGIVGGWEDPTIIVGGSNLIVLNIKALEIDDIESLELLFHSGLDLFLVKNKEDVVLRRIESDLYIEYTMDPETSSLIDYRKDFRVQCKLTLIGGNVIYTPIVKYKVVKNINETTINTDEEEEEGGMLGNGYF